LLATGNTILAEASPYDCKWGIGLSADDPRARNPAEWRGGNLLGEVLMEVREELLKSDILLNTSLEVDICVTLINIHIYSCNQLIFVQFFVLGIELHQVKLYDYRLSMICTTCSHMLS